VDFVSNDGRLLCDCGRFDWFRCGVWLWLGRDRLGLRLRCVFDVNVFWFGYGRRYEHRFGAGRHSCRFLVSWRWRRGLRAFHEPRRRERWRNGLRWLGLAARLPALDDCGRRIRERRVRGHDDISLTGQAVDELPRHDFFDSARRALHLDAVITLEERDHLLARRVEQFRDFINPNSGHSVCR
jgi:hypothetical protein